MTDELKQKLKSILQDKGVYLTETELSEDIEQITQAFTDAGYHTFRDRDGLQFMTGQTFYDRFKTELAEHIDTLQGIAGADTPTVILLAQSAAKKAAGLPELWEQS